MSTFKANLVSPEKLLFSDEVNQVDLPGLEGDFGVLAGHTPIVKHCARGSSLSKPPTPCRGLSCWEAG